MVMESLTIQRAPPNNSPTKPPPSSIPLRLLFLLIFLNFCLYQAPVNAFSHSYKRASQQPFAQKHAKTTMEAAKISAIKPRSFDTTLSFSQLKLGEDVSIKDMLEKIAVYMDSMVDPESNRFYYRCLPASGQKVHGHSPIRDLGTAWDTTTLLQHFRSNRINIDPQLEKRLSDAVDSTIKAYVGSWIHFRDVNGRSGVAISSEKLQETSNIAHSAFLILATTGAIRLNLLDAKLQQDIPLDQLVQGILSMQEQETGAFRIQFGSSDIFKGIEFYPGEALLALMSAYDSEGNISPETRNQILPAALHAFDYYSAYYHQGNVDDFYTSFFANWQVQTFDRLRSLVDNASYEGKDLLNRIARYVFELCDDIVDSTPWKRLVVHRYSALATVEIACGLEALADGTRLAVQLNDIDRAKYYWNSIQSAVRFLVVVQNQVPHSEGVPGYGGLGHGVGVLEQRLDVTGHTINALVKVYRIAQHIL